MHEKINHGGYIKPKGHKPFSYELKDGKITLHLQENVSELDESEVILAESYDNRQYAIFPEVPTDIGNLHIFPQNYSFGVDWIIEDFRVGSMFYQADFSFAELQYFCPSAAVVDYDNDTVTFKRTPKEIKSFSFEYLGRKCSAEFNVSSTGSLGLSNSNARADSHLLINFEKTGDANFIFGIYKLVDSVFAFICNRRNTDCVSMILRGEYPDKGLLGNKIVDKISCRKSTAYFYDKYREPIESNKIISKTFNVTHFIDHIDSLFQMVAIDLENGSDPDKASISISSMHASVKRKNLIDLEQSLQITGAFEFYVRKYLPSMKTEKTWHSVIIMVLDQFSQCKLFNSDARRELKSLGDHVVTEPSLEGKIVKAYKGYNEDKEANQWKALKPCINEDIFNPEEIPKLAREANLWRNELAHSKRSYAPNEDTIRAVRLMERLNYAIVMRQLGYNDDEIKELIDNALAY